VVARQVVEVYVSSLEARWSQSPTPTTLCSSLTAVGILVSMLPATACMVEDGGDVCGSMGGRVVLAAPSSLRRRRQIHGGSRCYGERWSSGVADVHANGGGSVADVRVSSARR
jgi:hypothetical protein